MLLLGFFFETVFIKSVWEPKENCLVPGKLGIETLLFVALEREGCLYDCSKMHKAPHQGVGHHTVPQKGHYSIHSAVISVLCYPTCFLNCWAM